MYQCINRGTESFPNSLAERERIGIPTAAQSADSHAYPPAIVLYLVDPFLCSGSGVGSGEEEEAEEVESRSMWLLALLRCYTDMLSVLPENIQPALVLQVRIQEIIHILSLRICQLLVTRHTSIFHIHYIVIMGRHGLDKIRLTIIVFNGFSLKMEVKLENDSSNLLDFRWCRVSTCYSRPVVRVLCTCSTCGLWLSLPTRSADAGFLHRRTSNPSQALVRLPPLTHYSRAWR